ncbi:MAG: MraY family glycosyltransferase [Patescibacteria group bacterium]
MVSWWPIPIALAFLISAWLTPVVRLLALRFGVIDSPDGGRKLHREPTPLLGGLAIVASFSMVTIGVLLSSTELTSGAIGVHHFIGFFIGIAILTIGGVVDDRFAISAKYSMMLFVLASLVAVLGGINVAKMTNPFGGVIVLAPIVASVVAFVWILAMTMTTKLLDGVDGLASSVSLVGSLMIAALALTPTYFQSDVALLALIFSASILGFILWNWHPAQIFLGESGSTVLGFTVGVLSVIAGSKMATALLVLGIPAIDVGLVAIRRWRAGKNPFTTADRRHFHFMLRDAGLSPRQVTLLYSLLALAFGVTSLLFASWQKVIALGFLGILAIIGISLLAKYLDDSKAS